MASEYDPLARDYHWLVADAILSGEYFIERHRRLLDALPSGARILDCACGIGSDAIGLARYGYDVTASDGSPAFVAEAERRARAAGVAIPFAACVWEELPHRFREPFDLVLCIGNSISHTPDRSAAVRALTAMRAVLKPGGTLLLDTRNWEKVRRERPRAEVADHMVERDGVRCVPIYLWEYEADWDAPHQVELLLILDRAGQISHRRYVLTYRPIRYEELLDSLKEARFEVRESDYRADTDRYEIVAVRCD